MRLSPQAFFTTQLSLLEAEQTSEVAETSLLLSSAAPSTLARAGLAVLNLNVNSLKTGLGGRTVIQLGVDPAYASTNLKNGEKGVGSKSEGDLPEHGIRTGDIVRVGEMPKGTAKKKEMNELKGKGVEGVVTRIGERALWVAAGKGGNEGSNDDSDVDALASGRLWVVKLANDVTYKRMNWALQKLLKTSDEAFSPLQRVLLGLSAPTPPDSTKLKQNLTFVNDALNESQKEAIKFAMASLDLALIHGPPGTGKTSTIVELILQLLKQDQRVLVCGPSNISVDNIVERLVASSPSTPIVRMGHPARLLPIVLNHSLEVLTRTSEAGAIVMDIREEIDQKIASTKKAKNGRERKNIWQEVKELRKEYRSREGKCVDSLIGGSAVVLATLHGAGSPQTTAGKAAGKAGFDVIVIDEAGQGLEAGCWVPIVIAAESAKKLVLAGDHLQLPPTIKSSDGKEEKEELRKRMAALEADLSKLSVKEEEKKAAKKLTLEHTMFDRLLKDYGSDIKRLLNTQYRMHEKIMRFPSDTLYDGKLVAAEAVQVRLLKDLEYGVEETDDTKEPLVFYDTQGGDYPEKTEDPDEVPKKSILLGDSKSNDLEAAVVKMHVQKLIAAGVKDEDIAVITPYNAQLAILQGMLREQYPGLELGSVDGFQGREKEAVVVSLVRSNDNREVGFLGEKRRLNVAMTRPRRHLCVVGDSETVGHGSSFLKKWMKYLEDNADLRYPTLDELDLT
ncbi:hypothetical protein PMZ80_005750 [Knufia obscura]|uniref:DNA helicase n=2 Tax=Knufia TaxID=430999 RepID=A0AAN8FA94_9EURO|nr:hypothetical protein PMZ80_005750 [Knufia obscura]KAK5954416.1 hypothetical protein OHC33_004138 [Knufia fluminis]